MQAQQCVQLTCTNCPFGFNRRRSRGPRASVSLPSHRFIHPFVRDESEEALPDPIPNSEVKLLSADGTAGVTRWESRSSRTPLQRPRGRAATERLPRGRVVSGRPASGWARARPGDAVAGAERRRLRRRPRGPSAVRALPRDGRRLALAQAPELCVFASLRAQNEALGRISGATPGSCARRSS